MKKALILAAGVMGLACGVVQTAAADGAALYTAKLCTTCHGADGKAPIMPSYPKLAGQNADYSLQQVKDIRDGKRTNGGAAAMMGLVKGQNLSDADAKEIVTWLSTK
ncbi:MAG: c-type cytochrome [Pseudomonadota bacterium]